MLAFTPLPSVPLLTAASMLTAIAWSLGFVGRLTRARREIEARAEAAAVPPEQTPVEELLSVDTLELEIGYGLVQLVDSGRGGDLLDRIAMIRRQLAVEIGIVVPPVRIRDNMQLEANRYRVKLRGAVIGEGTVYPELLMAMDSGLATGPLDRRRRTRAGVRPRGDMDRGRSQAAGRDDELQRWSTPPACSRPTSPSWSRMHADELLSREEVSRLLEQLTKSTPKACGGGHSSGRQGRGASEGPAEPSA